MFLFTLPALSASPPICCRHGICSQHFGMGRGGGGQNQFDLKLLGSLGWSLPGRHATLAFAWLGQVLRAVWRWFKAHHLCHCSIIFQAQELRFQENEALRLKDERLSRDTLRLMTYGRVEQISDITWHQIVEKTHCIASHGFELSQLHRQSSYLTSFGR